jgi:dCTP deaminase
VQHAAYVIVRAMAVLTHDVLLAEIAAGAIAIDPFDPKAIGPASIDLTLGDEIRVLAPGPDPIPIRDDSDYRNYSRVERLDRPYVLRTGETIHGITRERITLSPSLCGLLEGRSRFARLGLMIHVTSAFVQPGVSNRQVLEMGNVSGHPLEIHAGVRICQLVVLRAEGQAVYQGRFSRQEAL